MNVPRAAREARSTVLLVPFWLACGCLLVVATALAADLGHPVPDPDQVGGASAARAIRLEGDCSFSFEWLFPVAAAPLAWRLWKARRSGGRRRT